MYIYIYTVLYQLLLFDHSKLVMLVSNRLHFMFRCLQYLINVIAPTFQPQQSKCQGRCKLILIVIPIVVLLTCGVSGASYYAYERLTQNRKSYVLIF